MPAHRYMEENDLAAMLAAKRSAGVAPEVNFRECVNKTAHSGFETQRRRHQKSKQGYQWSHKKDLCRSKFFKISIQKILNNHKTFYLLAFLEAFSGRVASGQVDVCERRDLNERNGKKSGRTPETRHDSFLYIRWLSLRQG